MTRRSRRAGQRGQSLVEFSLLLPFMLLLLAGGTDFARIYFAGIETTDAAREAALYAAKHSLPDPPSLSCQGCTGSGSTCQDHCTGSVLAQCTTYCDGDNNQACTSFCYGAANNPCVDYCYGQNNSQCKQDCWSSGTGGNNLCLSYCTPNDGQCTSVCTWDGTSGGSTATLQAVANNSGNSPFKCPYYNVQVVTPVPGPAGTSEQTITVTCTMNMITNFLPIHPAVVLTSKVTALVRQDPVIQLDAAWDVDNQSAVDPMVVSAVNTSQANEVLVAFVASDGPATAQTATVSGAGLTWNRAIRANASPGDAEVWWAVAGSPLSNQTISVTRSAAGCTTGTCDGMVHIAAFIGASTTSPIGASQVMNGTSATPSVSLNTTKANSWVWAVGSDHSNATARTMSGTTVLQHEDLSTPNSDEYWVQSMSGVSPRFPTTTTLGSTSTNPDVFNLAAVEITP